MIQATINLSALKRHTRDVRSIQATQTLTPPTVAEESIEPQTDITASPAAKPQRQHGQRRRRGSSPSSPSESESSKRRRATGGLRLAPAGPGTDEEISAEPAIRRLQSNARHFPQRQKQKAIDTHVLQPSSLDKLITGIWEQIHGSIGLDPGLMVSLGPPQS